MQPEASVDPVRQRNRLVVAVVALTVLVLAAEAVVWYPTTLQPNVVMKDISVVRTASCVPIEGSWGNEYAYSFTLANAGSADGYASVQFILDGVGLGFQSFKVPMGSQRVEAGTTTGNLHQSVEGCGASESLVVSLATVMRSPEIDMHDLIYGSVSPVAALGFAGVMLGTLGVAARRRGIHLLQDAGTAGWHVAWLTLIDASLFSWVVTMALITPYNYPVDWTPVLAFGAVYTVIGVAVFVVAWVLVMRIASTRRLSA